MGKRMILLLNLGGPRSEREIPFFLKSLTGRTATTEMCEGAARRYAAIGGCSPLPALTEELARLLSSSLDSAETEVKAAFKHSYPSIEEAITNCCMSGVGEIIFFILSPYYNAKTTGAYTRTAEQFLSGLIDYRPATIFVHSWFAHPLFIDWWVKEVQKAAEFSKEVHFLFSAHAMPVSPEHDIYRRQVEETVRLIIEKAGLSSYDLAWQSVPPQSEEEWFGPSVEQTIDCLARRGIGRVIQVPIGFILDNLETLYDIDITHKRVAKRMGIEHRRMSCPNTDPRFVHTLSGILSSSLEEAL